MMKFRAVQNHVSARQTKQWTVLTAIDPVLVTQVTQSAIKKFRKEGANAGFARDYGRAYVSNDTLMWMAGVQGGVVGVE